MQAPAGYISAKEFASTRTGTQIQRATRQSDGLDVVLKTYLSTRFGLLPLERAHREAAALGACAGTGLPEVIEVLDLGSRAVLARTHAPGLSLHRWAAETAVSVDGWLTIARRLTEVVARIHEAHFLHLGLSPTSICIDPGVTRGRTRQLRARASARPASAVAVGPDLV